MTQPKAQWRNEAGIWYAQLGLLDLMVFGDGEWEIQASREDLVYARSPAPTGPWDLVTRMLDCEAAYSAIVAAMARFEPGPLLAIPDEPDPDEPPPPARQPCPCGIPGCPWNVQLTDRTDPAPMLYAEPSYQVPATPWTTLMLRVVGDIYSTGNTIAYGGRGGGGGGNQ